VAYQVSLIDRARREAHISRSVEAPTKYEDFYELRATKTALPVIRLPIGVPIYRMENFRTFSEQAEYIAREQKPADTFTAGQEAESVQQIQHEILAKLAAKGKSDSVTPVVDVLEREGQRESLLITHGGVVVNGNRRLAAMRELKIEYVDCMVLPADTTPTDILEIEAALQAKPETRLEYDWIGDAKLLAAMLRIKTKVEDVADKLNRKKTEVSNTLQALNEANIYLKDWRGAEGKYSLVTETGEQFFKDLPGHLQNKPVPLQEASRVLAWSLFDNVAKLDGRLYNYNAVFGKRAADVLDRLAQELGLPADESEQVVDGDFAFDLEEGSAGPNYQAVIDTFKDTTRRDEAIAALVEISVTIVESEKDKKSGGAALKSITSAHARLAEVDISKATPDSYEAADRQLTNIVKRATDLQLALTKLREVAAAKEETAQDDGA